MLDPLVDIPQLCVASFSTHTHTHTHIYIYIYIYVVYVLELQLQLQKKQGKRKTRHGGDSDAYCGRCSLFPIAVGLEHGSGHHLPTWVDVVSCLSRIVPWGEPRAYGP